MGTRFHEGLPVNGTTLGPSRWHARILGRPTASRDVPATCLLINSFASNVS
jgi:hypothetical protein